MKEFEKILINLVDKYGINKSLNLLSQKITLSRKLRIDKLLKARILDLQIAVENPANPHNAAAIVRSCDAFGVFNIHAITDEKMLILQAKKTTQGAFYWLETHQHENLNLLQQKLLQLQQKYNLSQKILIAGACVDAKTSIYDLDITQPLCLLFGTESHGLSTEAQNICDIKFHIPMLGMCESFNLSVAAAVSINTILLQKKQANIMSKNLSDIQQKHLQLKYYARKIHLEKLNSLLK